MIRQRGRFELEDMYEVKAFDERGIARSPFMRFSCEAVVLRL